jgi:organic hydroperoxide reductase OsmC/OhrA
MQKEAIVVPVRAGTAWRLASDEGPYLDGLDAAPCPLAFMTTGMVSSYMHEILALAKQRDVALRELVLVQDNHYTMEGSALRGTLTGGALPPALEVRIDTDADNDGLHDLVTEAVRASPVDGLLRPRLTARFTLTVNGDNLPVGRVAALARRAEPDPGDQFSHVRPAAGQDGETVTRLDAVRPLTGVAGGAGTSLRAEQRRQLHVRAVCRRRPDRVKEIEQHLYRPLGSTFRLLSDEAAGLGGTGTAPDAVSYMAAGLAFCFMTQLGRYAAILKRNMDRYRVVQDAHFSLGGSGHPGTAEAVETHVHLDTSEGEDFARQCLDMAEQTCFLHALCRTPLEPTITITRL